MCGTVDFILSLQLLEPVLLLGKERFAGVDIRVRVKGGGRVAQVYGQQEHLSHRLIDCKHVFLTVRPVFYFLQPSARPSPRPWSPTTRNVSSLDCAPLSWNVKWWTLGTHSWKKTILSLEHLLRFECAVRNLQCLRKVSR